MRIVADICASETEQEQALVRIRLIFTRHGLMECVDSVERRDAMDELIHDMKESDRNWFLSTVRIVSRHTIDETVSSINILGGGHILVRLRNPRLDRLMPRGTSLLDDILTPNKGGNDPILTLHACEIRERGNREGFLFGSWGPGEPNPLRFMYSQSKAFNICISLLFIVGLTLEVGLSLVASPGRLEELGLRLGAPMLVSSSVLLLERWAYWLKERVPRLRWLPAPPAASSSSRTTHAFERV